MIIGILILAYLLFSILSFVAFSSGGKGLNLVSKIVGFLTLLVHGAWILVRGVQAGRWPFINTYETLILLGFFTMVIFFLIDWRRSIPLIGGFVGLIVSILLALTSFLPSEIEPLMPALKSNWLLFHVVSAFIGYSGLVLAAATAAVYLFLKFYLKIFSQKAGKWVERLKEVDWMTHRLIVFGFPFLTLGIVTGAIWANASWGRYWNWDPKETWAFITWTVYVIYLHLRRDEKNHGTRTAIMSLFGFATVMFTYFGVNFWLASIHAYQ